MLVSQLSKPRMGLSRSAILEVVLALGDHDVAESGGIDGMSTGLSAG